jgi:glycosyltransferase involved in cell wall biosynthesis
VDEVVGAHQNGAPRGPVLQVTVSNQRRGAEVFAVDLAAELVRRGLAAPAVALAATEERNALPVRALGSKPLGVSTLRALRREAAAAGSVVAHGSRTLPACAVATAGTGVPFVYRSIGDPQAWSSRGMRRWRTTALLRRPRLVAALWRGAADALVAQHGVPVDRIRVIPNGVPVERCPVVGDVARQEARDLLGLPAEAPVVAYVGSLSAEKDVGAAVAAVADLPGVHLLVVGDGPDRAELEAQAARDAPGRVHFAGTLPQVFPALAAGDAVVLPSRTEGMPGVLVEAGLCGLPVVATGVGAVAEIVVDGETGMLVAPGDVAAMKGSLRSVLADDGAMGLAARAHCLARFEIRTVGAAWAELLRELVEPR